MSLYDDASLIMFPSGYKEDKIYSLKPTDGSGDLTFTRASTATRVNAEGLIEKVRTNVLLQSQNLAAAAWNVGGTATRTANYGTAPDGTQTSTRIEWTAAASFELYQYTGFAAPVYGSVYIKGTAGQTIKYRGNSVTLNGSWQRIEGAIAIDGANTFFTIIGTAGVNTAFDFELWAAQAERGDIATDYIPTTTAAVSVGMLADVPRIDYTDGGCGKLLLESQRTNLVTYSEQFDNANWSTSDVTVTANTTISPSGYQDADTINATAEGQRINQAITVSASTQYTFSFYAKKGTMVTPRYSVYDLSNGALIIAQVDYSNLVNTSTWSRVTATFTTPSGCTSIFVYPINGASTGTIFLWGCQLEAGSYVSSYVPTIASSVTRLADAAYKTGISSLIGQTEGVVFIDFVWNQLTGTGSYPRIIEAWNNSSNYIQLFNVAGTSTVYYEISNGGAIQFSGNTTMNLGRNKLALAYKLNDCVFYKNGSLIASDTSATIPTTNDLGICGTYNGTAGAQLSASVNQAILFPTRLTNAELATLTTL